MKTDHPSEIEIQQYALDRSGLQPDIIEHIRKCEACLDTAAIYQFVFPDIKQHPKPAFDFDLASGVLARLTLQEQPVLPERFLIYFLVFTSIVSISIPFFFFGRYIVDMFTGMLPMAMYLIAITAVIILLLQGIDMYKRYRKHMGVLKL